MSIVTGLATASGLSALLNAPRETTQDRTATTTESDKAVSVELSRTAQRINAMTGQARVTEQAEPQVTRDAPKTGTPDDSRLSKFVEAVQALRLDQNTAAALPPDRMRQYKEAAEEVFNMGDEVPRDVRPSERAYTASEVRKAKEAAQREAEAQRQSPEGMADPANNAEPVFAQAGDTAPVADAVSKPPDLPEFVKAPAAPEEKATIPDSAIASGADTADTSAEDAAPDVPVQPTPEPV